MLRKVAGRSLTVRICRPIRFSPTSLRTAFRMWGLLPLLVLVGCAGQVNMTPTLDRDTQVPPGQGVVVARVINASGMAPPLNQLTLAPENLNESTQVKPERMVSLRPSMHSSTLFASPVKAGHYAIHSLRAFYSGGDRYYSQFVDADAKLGTFEVKPGQVTDLGILIYYTKPHGDRYTELLLRIPDTEPAAVLNTHFPFYDYSAESVLGWLDDGNDSDRMSLYVSVAQNPVTFKAHYRAPDGSLYFLAKLGVILKRSAVGEWTLDAVDTNLDLTAIAVNANGDTIAGGREGALFYKPRDGSWQNISLNTNEHVEHLAFRNTGTVEMLVSNNALLEVRRTRPDNNKPDWELVNRFSSTAGWDQTATVKSDERRERLRFRGGDVYDVALYELDGAPYISVRTQSRSADPIFARIDRYTFQYDPESWLVKGEVPDSEITTVVDAGAVKLGIERPGFWSWSGRTDYYRYVGGRWQPISTHAYVCSDGRIAELKNCPKGADGKPQARKKYFTLHSVPWFRNSMEGVAIVDFSETNIWNGKRSHETKVLITRDGGQRWEDTGNELPGKWCTDIIPELSDRLMVTCKGVSGDFYESTDNGASWAHVRQQVNF